MPAPYNYLGGVQPVDLSREMAGITAGLGGGLATALQMQAAQQQARIEAEQQAALQAQFAEDMRDYSAAPSVEKYGLMLGRYPNMRKQLQEVQKRVGEDEKKAALSFISPTMSLLQRGQTDLAIEQIQQRNEALRNSGRPDAAASIANGEAMIKAIESGPEGVNAAIGQLIQDYAIASGVSDPAGLMEKQAQLPYAASYAEERLKEKEALAKKAQVQAENEQDLISMAILKDKTAVRQMNEQMRLAVEKHNLEEFEVNEGIGIRMLEFLQKGEELPPGAAKEISNLVASAATLQARSAQASDLARRFEQEKPTGGVAGSVMNALRKATGSDNPINALKIEFNQFKATEVGQMLAALKGASSDRDMKIFLEGVPDDTTNPKIIAEYLRGRAKALAAAAMLEDAKTDWISQNGGRGLAHASRDLVIQGVAVPRGTRFSQFMKDSGDQLVLGMLGNQEQDAIRRSSLGRYLDQGQPMEEQGQPGEEQGQSMEGQDFSFMQ